MRILIYSLAPLALLLALAVCASVLAYAVLWGFGDILPLAKLISKATLVLLLLSVFPLKKYLRLSWADLGFAPPAEFFKQIPQGLLLALISLAPVLWALYLLGVHVWDDSRVWSIGKICEKIALAWFFAMLIAVGEELLFRGLLMSGLRRKSSLITATAISSLYYAALHFLKSQSQITYADLSLLGGLRLVAEAFANWLNPAIFSALLSLFVVGVFLAVLRSKNPQSLGLCIGCHAGWVWQIKVSKDLLNVDPQTNYLYLVSNYDGVVGPLVTGWLTLALIAYWLISRRSDDVQDARRF